MKTQNETRSESRLKYPALKSELWKRPSHPYIVSMPYSAHFAARWAISIPRRFGAFIGDAAPTKRQRRCMPMLPMMCAPGKLEAAGEPAAVWDRHQHELMPI